MSLSDDKNLNTSSVSYHFYFPSLYSWDMLGCCFCMPTYMLIKSIIIVVILLVPLAAIAGDNRLFDSKETVSTNLRPFPKWNGALERYFDDEEMAESGCNDKEFSKCHLIKWRDFLDDIRQEDRHMQVKAVNFYMNQTPYILDPINWGVPDYWATPYQFYIKDGDCEDYSIAKFMSLRALGFSNDDMRVVVLKDENLDVIHAILAVYLEDKIYILDNQIEQLMEDTDIHHYTPIYSINETHWWRHR